MALSPALTDQEQASSILARWLQLTNTAAVWSGGLLKFIPYGDSATTAGTHITVTQEREIGEVAVRRQQSGRRSSSAIPRTSSPMAA